MTEAEGTVFTLQLTQNDRLLSTDALQRHVAAEHVWGEQVQCWLREMAVNYPYVERVDSRLASGLALKSR